MTKQGTSTSMDQLRSAVLQFTVNVIGALMLYLLYLNYILLKMYLRPLFWGALLSVPVHSLKRKLQLRIERFLDSKKSISLLRGFLALFLWLGELLLGPLWDLFDAAMRVYFTFMDSLFGCQNDSNEHSGSVDENESLCMFEDTPVPVAQTPTPKRNVSKISKTPRKRTKKPSVDASKFLRIKRLRKETSVLEPIRQFSMKWSHLLSSPSVLMAPSLADVSYTQELPGDANVNPTGKAHVTWLVVWCLRYLVFLFIKDNYIELTALIGCFALVIVLLHVMYYAVAWLYRKYTVSVYVTQILGCSWDVLLWPLSTCAAWVGRWFKQHMNQILALLIILMCGLATILSSSLMVFKVVQEGSFILDQSVQTLNRSVVANEHVSVAFLSVADSFKNKTMALVDKKIREHYPHANVTADLVIASVLDSYNYLLSRVRGNYGTSLHNHTPAQHNKGIFADMPLTEHLLDNLISWNVSAIIDLVGPVARELTSFSPFDHTISYASFAARVSSAFGSTAKYTMDWSLFFVASLFSLFVDAFDLVFQLFLFFGTLYTLTAEQEGVLLQYLWKLLIILDPFEHLKSKIEHAVMSALVVNLKLTLFHILIGWLSFSIVACEIVYIPAFIMGFLTLIPIISPIYVSLIGAISLLLRFSSPWNIIAAVSFVLVHVYVIIVLDTAIMDNEMTFVGGKGTKPSVTRPNGILLGLAFWLGYWQFGFPEGLVLGPLIIACVPIFVAHLYSSGSS